MIDPRFTLLGRRDLLAAGGAIALVGGRATATVRDTRPGRIGGVDFGSPFDDAVARLKMLTTFGETPVFGGLSGVFYATVGDDLTPLFGYAGYRLHQSRIVGTGADRRIETRGKEAGCYTDLATGERITRWRNPWTGEDTVPDGWVDTGRSDVVALDRPAGSFLLDAYGARSLSGVGNAPAGAGKVPFGLAWTRVGDRYLASSDSTYRFTNPVTAARWPKASTGPTVTQHELLKVAGDARAIDDARAPHASFSGTLTRDMPWLPFMRMGGSGVAGRLLGVLQIWKTDGTLADVPPTMRRWLAAEHPDLLRPMTSWEATAHSPGGTWQHYAQEVPPEA